MAWEPDYVTREELKDYVTSHGAGVSDTEDNAWLDLAVTAASRAIDRECSKHRFRQFGLLATVETRYFTAQWRDESARWVIEIDDLMTSVGLVIAIDVDQDDDYEITLGTSDYVLRPRSAASLLRPWTQLAISRSSSAQPMTWPEAVAVTAKWGWTTVPSTIKQATMILGSRFFQRKDSPFGVKGSPDSDSEEKQIFEADPDVCNMLRSYVRLKETP